MKIASNDAVLTCLAPGEVFNGIVFAMTVRLSGGAAPHWRERPLVPPNYNAIPPGVPVIKFIIIYNNNTPLGLNAKDTKEDCFKPCCINF